MVSKAKLYSQLDRMEEELREGLIPHLEHAATGRNELVFCVPDFNPFQELRSRTDSRTDELVQLGRQILALREKLGEPSDGTIAERICWYCRKWGDTRDSHRKAAQGLAKEFLQEILDAEV
jgi:hypothetical protein